MSSWVCRACGKSHAGLAYVFGSDEPYPWQVASIEQRNAGHLDSDLCVLPEDGQPHFYVRAQLQLPIVPEHSAPEEFFVWSVWMSLSRPNFKLLLDVWDDPGRVDLEPMPSWCCSDLPYDPSPLGLRSRVVQRPPGVVPYVELDPSEDHPLVEELYHGIDLHRVAELNRKMLKGR